MSYEKQTWQTGDIITAEKLNHIEDGIEKTGLYHYGFYNTESLTINSQSSAQLHFSPGYSNNDLGELLIIGGITFAKNQIVTKINISTIVGETSKEGAYIGIWLYNHSNDTVTIVPEDVKIYVWSPVEIYSWE